MLNNDYKFDVFSEREIELNNKLKTIPSTTYLREKAFPKLLF